MATVDAKGRVALPEEIRDRLGITPGTEVEIHQEDGAVVVVPENEPERIVERLERLVEETAPEQGETRPLDEGPDAVARNHRDAVRNGARPHNDA
jgi:AbrB family looped-hinge helix DNA binding protein